ncbi:hypothetical protein OS493_003168 [Desmophyllum pertusum]|uniref:Uncharacterized protein n=1 Tax=Desmophyllum pertusum TaxID=174260 RepID=A0A9W9YGL3_9CNID|nr:hypothetical protein OS493_003168 [Desmophyllum pertusum]
MAGPEHKYIKDASFLRRGLTKKKTERREREEKIFAEREAEKIEEQGRREEKKRRGEDSREGERGQQRREDLGKQPEKERKREKTGGLKRTEPDESWSYFLFLLFPLIMLVVSVSNGKERLEGMYPKRFCPIRPSVCRPGERPRMVDVAGATFTSQLHVQHVQSGEGNRYSVLPRRAAN